MSWGHDWDQRWTCLRTISQTLGLPKRRAAAPAHLLRLQGMACCGRQSPSCIVLACLFIRPVPSVSCQRRCRGPSSLVRSRRGGYRHGPAAVWARDGWGCGGGRRDHWPQSGDADKHAPAQLAGQHLPTAIGEQKRRGRSELAADGSQCRPPLSTPVNAEFSSFLLHPSIPSRCHLVSRSPVAPAPYASRSQRPPCTIDFGAKISDLLHAARAEIPSHPSAAFPNSAPRPARPKRPHIDKVARRQIARLERAASLPQRAETRGRRDKRHGLITDSMLLRSPPER